MLAWLGAAALLGAVSPLSAQTIVGSRHDLSPGGGEICVYCHTPHGANTLVTTAPLWNRVVITKTYDMYGSPSMDSAVPATPGARSLVCLGCHDGNSAEDSYGGVLISDKHGLLNPPASGGGAGRCSDCHNLHGPPKQWTGTNLSNDHPISFAYPAASVDPEFNAPPDANLGWGEDAALLFGGFVECPTCHDVHDPTNGSFLRMSNAGSALCLTCHAK